MSETQRKDMNFLCELREFIRQPHWDCNLALAYVEKAIDDIEKQFCHTLGEQLYYKRLDHENFKKRLKIEKKRRN